MEIVYTALAVLHQEPGLWSRLSVHGVDVDEILDRINALQEASSYEG